MDLYKIPSGYDGAYILHYEVFIVIVVLFS